MNRYLETLESRRLFSADLPAVQAAPGAAADGIVTIQWQGRQLTMKEGEWIVGFQHRPRLYSEDGTLIDPGVDSIGPNLSPEQLAEAQAPYDALGLGIQFMQYLGIKQTALIKVPRRVTVEQLSAALAKLEGFENFEPNAYGQAIDVPSPSQVTAFVRGGVLVVRGDSRANSLRIDQDAETGGLVLVGLDGTTINGEETVAFAGVTQGVRVKLGDGRDELTFAQSPDAPTPPALAGDVTVNLGRGRDFFDLSGLVLEGNLSVQGSGDAKTVRVLNASVLGTTSILCGAGVDSVELAASTFGGRVLLRTGVGDDIIKTGMSAGATFASGLLVRDGSGNDLVDGSAA
jgi:hypothetical protein